MKEIDLNKEYILNPKYVLKHDHKRTLVVTRSPYENSDEVDCDTYSFIHPVQAMIFSFFDGKQNLECTISKISEFTNMSFEKCYADLSKYIHNETLSVTFKEKKILYPKNFIIEKNAETYFIYNVEDFLYQQLDFDSFRLFNGPLDITLMLNNSCYTDCIYCYADCQTEITDYLSVEQISRLIEECKKIGVRNIGLMGGEVLKHPNWEKVISELVNNNYHPYISTKIPLNLNKIKRLKSTGLKEIQLSIDTLDLNIAQKTLKVKHCYIKQLKETVENLQEEGFSIIINSVVTKYNCSIKNYEEILNYLLDFNAVRKITVTPIGFSLYKSEDNFNTIKPSLQDLNTLIEFLETKNENMPFEILQSGFSEKEPYFSKEKSETFNLRTRCTANQDQIYILPNGDVTLCEELMFDPIFIIGNIKDETIMELWKKNRFDNLLRKKLDQDSKCSSCTDYEECHNERGVCWKEVMYAYGKENWHYPDPRCPKSLEPTVEFYLT
jgi:radical SAM protein with 4Fe4S-binding SPASM domain